MTRTSKRRPLRAMPRLVLLTSTAVLLGCPGDQGPRLPTRVEVSPSEATLTALGATQQFTAQVVDEAGDPVTDVAVEWSCVNHAVAGIDASGTATALDVGTTEIEATAEGLTGTASLTVQQTPSELVKVAGDTQTAPVATAVPRDVTVELRDSRGNPIRGDSVSFAVTAGEGSVAPTTQSTGDDGRASATWTLGTDAGVQTLEARASGISPAVFNAEATPASPDTLVVTAGNGQTGPAGEAVADSLAVEVRDAHGNPVPGATVHWVVTAGGGSLSPASVATTSAGARSEWTLGTVVGANEAEARVSGLTPVGFTATAVSGAPDAMTKTAGDEQVGVGSETLPTELEVEVTDAYGNPVPDVPVTFTPSAGSVSASPVDTDGNGRARTAVTLPDSGGTVTVTAEVSGVADVTFTAQAIGTTTLYLYDTGILSITRQTDVTIQSYFYRTTKEWSAVIQEGSLYAGDVTFYVWLAASSAASFQLTLVVGGVEVATTTFDTPYQVDPHYEEYTATVDGVAAGAPGDTITLRVTHSGSSNGGLLYGAGDYGSHVEVTGEVEIGGN